MDTVIVNNEDVLQVVRDINITKAASVDHLSARVLKDAFMVLIDKLVLCTTYHLQLALYQNNGKYHVLHLYRNKVILPMSAISDR